jgi:N6-L-threonylcarbamoyladenine synthase
MSKSMVILAIESSCDETSAAVLFDLEVKSNIIASQSIHEKYGGVVPELASRAHQSNIVPVVEEALKSGGIRFQDIDLVACTHGPGLLGALQVGVAYSKSLSMALQKPLVLVNHMQAHILAHFIQSKNSQQIEIPDFPFLCLTVSGGHTQLVMVYSPLEMKVVGKTIDDAAGEAFDKAAKVMGLPYPGGPHIDRLARQGNSEKFKFTIPNTGALDFSFSGLKTSLLYLIQKESQNNPDFVSENIHDLAASYQKTIIHYLMKKMELAIDQFQPASIGLAGGVSANSGLRESFCVLGEKTSTKSFIPPFEYTTDNAAMIGASGYFMHQFGFNSALSDPPLARLPLD